MLVIFKKDAEKKEIASFISRLENQGTQVKYLNSSGRVIVEITGLNEEVDSRLPSLYSFVDKVIDLEAPFKKASLHSPGEKTTIEVNGQVFGGENPVVIAGPCSIESEEQIFGLAASAASAGVKILRGGAFKPRTSPYSFQGLGEEGLKLIRKAAEENNLAVITEIIDSRQLDLIYPYTDIFQVGARNMQNFALLKELGKTGKPVLLKRGIGATIDELLLSAEYILDGGNMDVILCERGVRGFDKYTRFTFDVSAIPVLKGLTHLPVIADPSHAAGLGKYVPPLAKAAIAAGADGLMLEIHNNPKEALSDGPQAISADILAEIVSFVKDFGELQVKRTYR